MWRFPGRIEEEAGENVTSISRRGPGFPSMSWGCSEIDNSDVAEGLWSDVEMGVVEGSWRAVERGL